jgi:hypothetical protein
MEQQKVIIVYRNRDFKYLINGDDLPDLPERTGTESLEKLIESALNELNIRGEIIGKIYVGKILPNPPIKYMPLTVIYCEEPNGGYILSDSMHSKVKWLHRSKIPVTVNSTQWIDAIEHNCNIYAMNDERLHDDFICTYNSENSINLRINHAKRIYQLHTHQKYPLRKEGLKVLLDLREHLKQLKTAKHPAFFNF